MSAEPAVTSVRSAVELTGAAWRKSSRSGDQGACVEMAPVSGVVAVRDSTDPAGPALLFTLGAWTRFTSIHPGAHWQPGGAPDNRPG
jgi:hypothetical protein